jgi:uncharacterized membrane protein
MKTSSAGSSSQMTTRSTADSAHDHPAWEYVNPLLEKDALANFNHLRSEQELRVWANQSISNRALRNLLLSFALLCMLVASFSFCQGNVMAPIFMLLDFAIVALALKLIAAQSNVGDALRLEARDLLVLHSVRGARELEYRFPLAWVRINVEQHADQTRIWLSASGQSVEFGSFLNTQQRASLSKQVESFLDLAKSRALSTL